MKFAYLIEPPFNFSNSHGVITGCDVELARKICHALDLGPFEPVETEFSELLPGLNNNRWQMTTGLFDTPERRRSARFSYPIWALTDGFLLQGGNPLSLCGYRSVATHPSARLGVIRNQFQHRSAVEFGIPEDRIRIYDTYLQAAAAVSSGEINAYASVARAHAGYTALNPELAFSTLTVPAAEKPAASGSFAFSPNDRGLASQVNEFLRKFLGSCEHREMMRGFGFSDAEVDLVAGRAGKPIPPAAEAAAPPPGAAG